MPVEYRVGAGSAHPHALVQLWTEAARGDMNHHPAPAHRGHNSHAADAPPVVVADLSGPDVPELSPSNGPAEQIAAFAAAGALGVLLIVFRSRVMSSMVSIRRGRRLGPEPPPPRRWAVC